MSLERDCQALLNFGNLSTNFLDLFSPPRWDTQSANWCCLESQPAYGVTCTNGRVTRLMLRNLDISGSFMPSFSDMSALNVLALDRNNLEGTLDPLSSMNLMTQLLLYSNNLEGTLEPLSSMSLMTSLQLGNNNVEGMIDSVLSAMTQLIRLSVEGNSFQGSCNLEYSSRLVRIELSRNRFSSG